VGVGVISVFGALWFLLGLVASQRLSATTGVLLAGATLVLVLLALALARRAAALPRSEVDPERARQVKRVFGRVNAVQWVVISITAFVLGRLQLDAYIPAAVTLIVGLHFFPLGRLFRYPQHHITGIALVVWGVDCLALVPRGSLQATTGFGTGAILWVSALVTLVRGFRLLSRTRANA
jgi:hypothetical protein